MDSRNKRLSKAVAFALTFHVLAAAVIGIIGIQNREKLPPQVIEITLDAGGGGGGGNSGGQDSGVSDILKDLSDAVEKVEQKEIPEAVQEKEEFQDTERKEVKEEIHEKVPTGPAVSEGGSENAFSSGEGTGSGGGKGSGDGTGIGSGEGEGAGSGSGGGEGSGTGNGSGGGSGEGAGMPVTAPVVISSVRPEYPLSAKNAEVEGVAYVSLSVDASGSVTEAVIAGSTGNPALDRAAVEAAYRWRFSPALDRYGQPSPCHITIPFQFSLHN